MNSYTVIDAVKVIDNLLNTFFLRFGFTIDPTEKNYTLKCKKFCQHSIKTKLPLLLFTVHCIRLAFSGTLYIPSCDDTVPCTSLVDPVKKG